MKSTEDILGVQLGIVLTLLIVGAQLGIDLALLVAGARLRRCSIDTSLKSFIVLLLVALKGAGISEKLLLLKLLLLLLKLLFN